MDFKVGYDRDKDKWVLLEPLEIWLIREYQNKAESRTITIPQGTHTDLASVPRPLWHIIPKSGAYNLAAIVHDYMYQIGYLTDKLGFKEARYLADLQFYREMRFLGVGVVKANLMYLGVRIGGRNFYGRGTR